MSTNHEQRKHVLELQGKIMTALTGCDDSVRKEVSGCFTDMLRHLNKQPTSYAEVAWCAEDITDVYDVSEERAAEFLCNNGHRLQEDMIEYCWGVIDALAKDEDMKLRVVM